MKSFTLSLFLATFFFLPLAACAKTTQPFHGAVNVATGQQPTEKGYQDPLPENFWQGDEDKAWAQVRRADGKLVWVSFQNAPARTKQVAKKKAAGKTVPCNGEGWKFSVAWRTDKTTHPGESDGQYAHVGVRCYGNTGQCPPTAGEAWQNVLKLINQPTPPIPANWKPDMVYGPWLGSCD